MDLLDRIQSICIFAVSGLFPVLMLVTTRPDRAFWIYPLVAVSTACGYWLAIIARDFFETT